MGKVKTTRIVRFGDLDMLGHLNNAIFVSFVEEARVEYVKKLSYLKGDFKNEEGISFILARLEIDFLKPAYMHDQIEISAEVTKIGTKSFNMSYELKSLTHDHLIAKAISVQVMFDYKKNCTIPVPEALKKEIQNI